MVTDLPKPRSRPTRRAFLSGASTLALAGPAIASLPSGRRRGREGRPNVLFITADQHRFDVAGFAGDAHAHTPNLDRLAGEGTRITDVYCQSPLCVPARQTLVTGRYAHDHGSFANWFAFAPGEWTVARALAAAGYDTAFFGKTHADTAGFRTVVDRNEMVRAFRADHVDAVAPGKIHRRGPQARKSFKLHQMNPGTLSPGDESVSVFHMDEAVVRRTAAFLARRDREAPFFIWASLLAPHPPFYPPEEWLARFRDARLPFHAPLSAEAAARLPARERERRAELGLGAVTSAEMLGITRSYYAAVAWADHNVGRLLSALEEAGCAEDTLVVYTSDHGEMLGEHGLMFKQSFYEGAVRVPCLVRYPGVVTDGGVLDGVVQHVDLVATLLDFAGLEAEGSGDLPGVSWTGAMSGGSTPEVGRALSELAPRSQLPDEVGATVELAGARLQQMLRVGRHKYVRYGADDELLFDLVEDPGETRDLAGDPKHASTLARLRSELAALTPETVTVRGPSESHGR